MRKLILALITVISLSAVALAQSADAKAKAEQILKQARAAIGDEKKLKELQALSATGAARQTFGDMQFESELEIELLMPDKVRKTTNNQRGTETLTFSGADFWRDFVPAMGGGPGGGGGFVIRQGGGPGGPGGPGGFGGPGGPGGANSPMAAFMQLQQRREFYQIMLGWLLITPASAQVEFAFIGEAPGPEGSKLNVLDGKGANGFNVRLYFDQQTHQLIGLSYKAKQLRGMMGGGRGPGGPGGGPGGGQGGQRQQQGAQAGQPGQPGQAGQPGQGGQPVQRVEISPEERERRMKEAQERFDKAPEVDYRWAFTEYKSVGGLNLPHVLTKMEGNTPNEEWKISKFKINPKLAPEKFVKKERPQGAN
jgi:hypothetical protein